MIECYYCGTRNSPASQACSKCSTDFSFLRIPTEALSYEQLHAWLFASHFQICERVEASGLASLTASEQANYLVGYLYFQVENGGVWQYFFNPCGPDAPLLEETLWKIGARKTAEAMSACLTHFPRGLPPVDMDARSEIIDQIPEIDAQSLDTAVVTLLLGEQSSEGLPEEEVLRLLKQAIDSGALTPVTA